MRIYYVISAFLVAALFCCCQGDHTASRTARLERVDSIIDEQPDTALAMLRTIDMAGASDADVALFNLLQTQALYINYLPVTSDSLINVSIGYYRRCGDKAMLARACYYKGAAIYDIGRKKDALKFLKEAESIAEEIDDETLLGKIYERTCHLFYDLGYASEYLKYSKLFHEVAVNFNDTSIICTSLNEMAAAYSKLDMNDSVRACLRRLAEIQVEVDDSRARSIILANIGNMYLDCDCPDSAKIFLDKSLAVDTLPYSYLSIGKYLLHVGDSDSAMTLLQAVAKGGEMDDKISAYTALKGLYEKKGSYREAVLVADSLKALNDSIQKYSYDIAEMQTGYDKDQEHHKTRSFFIVAIVLFCVVMLFGGIMIVVWIRKGRKKHLHDLTMWHRREKKLWSEIDGYKRKIVDVRHEMAAEQRRNYKLLNDIQARAVKNIFCISDEEIDSFVVFYHELTGESSVAFKYNKRRRKQELFLILQSVGYKTAEIADFMCTTTEAVRTMRSRIKNCK